MTTGRRLRFTADFKRRVALEALRGDRMVQEIADRHLQRRLCSRESGLDCLRHRHGLPNG